MTDAEAIAAYLAKNTVTRMPPGDGKAPSLRSLRRREDRAAEQRFLDAQEPSLEQVAETKAQSAFEAALQRKGVR